MEGSESEAIFESFDLKPQLFINEALNRVDELVDGAFDYFHQYYLCYPFSNFYTVFAFSYSALCFREAARLLKTEGADRSEDLKLVCICPFFPFNYAFMPFCSSFHILELDCLIKFVG